MTASSAKPGANGGAGAGGGAVGGGVGGAVGGGGGGQGCVPLTLVLSVSDVSLSGAAQLVGGLVRRARALGPEHTGPGSALKPGGTPHARPHAYQGQISGVAPVGGGWQWEGWEGGQGQVCAPARTHYIPAAAVLAALWATASTPASQPQALMMSPTCAATQQGVLPLTASCTSPYAAVTGAAGQPATYQAALNGPLSTDPLTIPATQSQAVQNGPLSRDPLAVPIAQPQGVLAGPLSTGPYPQLEPGSALWVEQPVDNQDLVTGQTPVAFQVCVKDHGCDRIYTCFNSLSQGA